MSDRKPGGALLLPLVYAGLSTAIVSSLGMLLVPTMAQQFSIPVSTAQWMLTANLLVGAMATPIMGRLSDGPHKKRLLMIVLLIILAGSIIAALAPTFSLFLVGRSMQGLSYGIIPVAISIARRYLPADKVQFGISSLSVTLATGIGIGYPLTGIIAGALNYRFAFWFAALFVLSALIVLWRAVPKGPDEQAHSARFDFAGAALLGLGLGALLLSISEGPNWGWASVSSIAGFALAVVVLFIWVRVELRSSHPLINLRVLRQIEVLLANATALSLGTAMYIALSLSSLIAQAPESTGYGIALPLLLAGFVMFPMSAGSFAANRLVHLSRNRVNMRTLLPIGASLVAVSTVIIWFAHATFVELLGGMLLFGLGVGTTYAAMPGLIARSVITAELGSAVSFNQVLRSVGGSLGSAIAGAVLALHLGPDLHPTTSGIDTALAISAIGCACVFAALLVNYLRSRRATGLQPLSA